MAQDAELLERQRSLDTSAARNLATTTKTIPQMAGITPRWFSKLLPWVNLESGTYRVNRKRLLIQDDRKIRVDIDGGDASISPDNLRDLSMLRDLDDNAIEAMAASFTSERIDAGEVMAKEGEPGEKFFIIARGKVDVTSTGSLGQKVRHAVLGDGDYFGEVALIDRRPSATTVKTLTPCVVLALTHSQFDEVMSASPEVKDRIIAAVRRREEQIASRADDAGEHLVETMSGHEGEIDLPESYVDYDTMPREYPLSAIQSVLRVHTRVSDLYNNPINQLREQLRLTVEAIKEKQEWELINSRQFGLLNVATPSMRIQTRSGPPTPDDMDELLARVWKKPAFFLAHPRAIAAFGRECTRRGVPPPTIDLFGSPFLTWRGVPLIPSDKIGIHGHSRHGKIGTNGNGNGLASRSVGTTSILLVRVGEENQGIVGLHQSGVPGEIMPSLSTKFMGIDNQAVASYLVTLYFSLAVLVEDAVGVLENVDVSNYYDYM